MTKIPARFSPNGDVTIYAGEVFPVEIAIRPSRDGAPIDLTGRTFVMTAYVEATAEELKSISATAAGDSVTLTLLAEDTEALFDAVEAAPVRLMIGELVEGGAVVMSDGLLLMSRAPALTASPSPPVTLAAAPYVSVTFVQGSPGAMFVERGAQATILLGNVVTGAPGSAVSIENVGTPHNMILDFSIPGTGVFNIDMDGGSTGLSFTGGPITDEGIFTLGGTLAVEHGGTAATTPAGARASLSAAKLGANSDITSLSGLTTALSGPQGGTGQAITAVGDLLIGAAANGWQRLAAAAAGMALISGPVPAWGKIGLDTHVSDVLMPPHGGLGSSAVPENGQLPVGSGGVYAPTTLGNGAGIAITAGAASLSIANSGVLSLSGGTTGLTPTPASTGALTLGGTLLPEHGGTGVTTATGTGSVVRAVSPTLTTPVLGDATASSITLTSGTIANAPTGATDIANKAYVDGAVTGLSVKNSCNVATAAALPACTYANGASGVGATLTGNANGALTVDGLAVSAGWRVLVKNQAAAAQNGLYIVTQAGSAGTPFILTRASDSDIAAELQGAFTFIEQGSVNATTGWANTNSSPPTIGTTGIVYAQFSGAGTYTAGAGLTLAGSQFSISDTAVTPGGYALGSFTVDQQGRLLAASSATTTGSGAVVLANAPTLTLANATGLPIAGITGLGTGVASALGTPVSGSGGIVLATSPTLTTPNLGTPSAVTLTNATGLPIATGLSGLGGANRIPYATSTTALTTSSAFTYDGTTFRVDAPASNAQTIAAEFLNSSNSGTPSVGIALGAITSGSNAIISNQYSFGGLLFTISTRDTYSGTSRVRYGISSAASGTNIFHYWNKGDGTEAFRLHNSGGLSLGNTIDPGATNLSVAGSLGIGATSLTGYGLRLSKNLTGATTAYGIELDATIQSDVTALVLGIRSRLSTAAASFTLPELYHFYAGQGAIGAGSAVTKQYGFMVTSSLTGAATNYAFYGNLAVSGSARWNLYMNGNAPNYLAGNLFIGTTVNSELLTVAGAGRYTGASGGFGAGTEGASIDFDGSLVRLGHVNGVAGSAKPVTILTGGNEKWRFDSSGNFLMGVTAAGTTAATTLQMANGTAPTANISGGQLYVEGGALKYRGSSGTVTTLAAA
jgi:hypothetical protein